MGGAVLGRELGAFSPVVGVGKSEVWEAVREGYGLEVVGNTC